LTALFVFAMVSSAATVKIHEYKPAGPAADKFVQDEILVKFKPAVSDDEIMKINRGLGIAEAHRTYNGVIKLKVPEKKLGEMIEAYKKLTAVEYAEPNYIAHTFAFPDDPPNDPFFSLQWNMHDYTKGGIQADTAWGFQTGEPSVVVAVVDTGVAYENNGRYAQAPDLANTVFVQGYDFVENDSHPNDDNSHGTHVAGTISQSTNNNIGVAGVAFNTAIMPVKVLNKNGSGTYTAIADGIKWAADKGAQVINLSLGGSSGSITLENALKYAHDEKGVTIIAAAGNDGKDTVSYPAAYDAYVIAVGATRYDKTRAYYSNYGPSLDLVAPGGDVNVDQNGDGYGDGILQNTFNPTTKNTKDFGYWFFQGTSMAAPHVSGVAALLIANGVTGPDNVRNVLQSTAKDQGDNDQYGYGLVDAYGALKNSLRYNDPPVAADDSVITNKDTPVIINVLSNDYDPDEDNLKVSYLTQPSNGTAVINIDNTVTYSPKANFNGIDYFTYTIRDSKLGVSTATVTITVTPVNDAPFAADDSYTTEEDTELSVTAPGVLGNDSDVDGDALTAVLVSGPANGTLALDVNGSFTYTPNADWFGTDSFAYKANDGIAYSNIATVSITVNPISEPPDDTDTTPPAWPVDSTLSAISVTSSSLTLEWPAASDNVGVTTYVIYKNGKYLGEVDGSTYQYEVSGLSRLMWYTFKVEAGDLAGNWTTNGPSVRVRTPK